MTKHSEDFQPTNPMVNQEPAFSSDFAFDVESTKVWMERFNAHVAREAAREKERKAARRKELRAQRKMSEQRQEIVGKAEGSMAEAIYLLYELWRELEEVRDNLEETFSGTERYQRLEDLIGSLQMVKEEVEYAKNLLPVELLYHLDSYEKANRGSNYKEV